ncbi:terminase [Micromonospora sp. NPDC049580]|uniref:terminase n=1 Tax=Micromonospora sp. NPDC049580 TaxID=3154832 RepID=UPI00341D8627
MTGPPGPCGCGCALTPESSYGFDVDEFARDVLRHPLDPWQRWSAIHGGELLPDGSPRFSIVLILVARQNGKTELLVVLALFWLYVARIALVLGTSTKLDYAKESWKKAVKLARAILELADEIPKRGGVRRANGEQELVVVPPDAVNPDDPDDPDACRYKIAAANEEGGRSLSIGRFIADELRQHHSYDAWDAAEPATSAVDGSQIFALSNAGDDRSIVLNDLRETALSFITSGDGDGDVMLAEWSAPEDADPLDLAALAQANPNLGTRKNARKLLANARRAVARGGKALNGFKTEHMCIRVRVMNPAIDPGAWKRCLDVGGLDAVRSRVAMCLDVAPDQLHATLYAAAVLPDGRVRIDFVKDWAGQGCVDKMRRELPPLVTRLRPKVLGWLPAGPAAAASADLAERKGWPPPGVKVEAIRGETAAVCMGLDKEVVAKTLAHSGDPLLNQQVGSAERLRRGDTWVFSRRAKVESAKPKGDQEEGDQDAGTGHVDAVYAAAGAVHLARTLPAPVGKPRVVVVTK